MDKLLSQDSSWLFKRTDIRHVVLHVSIYCKEFPLFAHIFLLLHVEVLHPRLMIMHVLKSWQVGVLYS